MTVYALAQLTIINASRYRKYQDGFLETLKPFGGRLLAADEEPLILEGDWKADKVVLLQFADQATFDGWIHSPAYSSICVDRRAGAIGPILLVHGVDASN